MNVLTIAWSMCSAVGGLLALIQFLIWALDRKRLSSLLAALMASGASAGALLELGLATAESIDSYQLYIKWMNLAIFAILIPMVWFVYVYLGTAKRSLAIAITALWSIGIVINFVGPGNLTFTEIVALRRDTAIWGGEFTLVDARESPFKLIADLASILIFYFVVDASIRAYRAGSRRKSLVVGGAIIFFIVVAGVHTPLVDAGIVHTPFMISFAFVSIALALSVELVADVVKAARHNREIIAREARWYALLEQVQLIVVAVDKSGCVDYVNPLFQRIGGYSKDQFLGKPYADIIPTTIADGIESDSLARGDQALRQRLRKPLISTLGDEHRVAWSVVELHDSEGESDGFLAIGEDVTARLHAERELKRAQREMERYARTTILGELASTLAHELNQPLAATLSNAQAASRFLAVDQPDLQELSEILNDIVRDTKRGGEIIHRMRAMLAPGETKFEDFELTAAVDEVVDLISSEVDAHQASLIIDLSPGPFWVRAGRVEFQQVLINLILNGVQAVSRIDHKDPVIRVTAERHHEFVRVVVEDNGPGIPSAAAARIFDSFFTTKRSGLGMGLSISKRIIEAYGGELSAENRAEGGARFAFTLACSQDSSRSALD